MRLTRCDICTREVAPGRGGYRVERIDNALTGPDAHGYWDTCSDKCLSELAAMLADTDDRIA